VSTIEVRIVLTAGKSKRDKRESDCRDNCMNIFFMTNLFFNVFYFSVLDLITKRLIIKNTTNQKLQNFLENNLI
jgi:hypothetical protein